VFYSELLLILEVLLGIAAEELALLFRVLWLFRELTAAWLLAFASDFVVYSLGEVRGSSVLFLELGALAAAFFKIS